MAADYLRTGPVIGPPLESSTSDRLLAEIKAELVELVHELKTSNDLARAQAEMLRRLTLEVHSMAVHVGRFWETGR